MKIRIGSRQSHLARLQAYCVGQAIEKANPEISISYHFKESLGDKNLTDPLWKMPERGVFTEDFVDDLLQKRVDVVVHSWKDLPTEQRPGLKILATLPRADARDLLLLRPDSLVKKKLTLFTSSPRRSFSALSHLTGLLPQPGPTEFETTPVRGNVLTRVRKLCEGQADGLFIAKAALDRLLESEQDEFSEARLELRRNLLKLRWMVLPLSLFPAAPAQGALAIEGLADLPELEKIFSKVTCSRTAACVERERQRFSSFGGGCHQQIGLTVLDHPRLGWIEFFFGRHQGKTLRHIICENSQNPPSGSRWPSHPSDGLFDRGYFETQNPGCDLFVARSDALPENWVVGNNQLVWTAGVESWRRLANRGIWVNGTFDGLGESVPQTDSLAGRPCHWTKLTHDKGVIDGPMPAIATYQLMPKDRSLPLVDDYFWMSASAFRQAIEINPEILKKSHASGPGHTAATIEKIIGRPVKVYINYRHWNEGNPCAEL